MVKNIFSFILFFVFTNIYSQSIRDASVELSAQVQVAPAKITLNWLANSGTSTYTIYRKLKNELDWGNALATLNGSTNQYTDFNVTIGVAYEYKVLRTMANGILGYGYILTGIEVPAVDNRGIIILVIDNTFITSLAPEIKRLINDLEGDGWKVRPKYVSRTAAVTVIKTTIVNEYLIDPNNTKAVFLLGRIPVPYSGLIYPDGHPDHNGAWPTDAFYADMDGTWTDVWVNNTQASQSRNRNIPGDGKYDQSYIPSYLELQVGRVDLSNMPAFANSELLLLRNYLDKDNAYRNKQFTVSHRAVIDDNFGYFYGEAFAASGLKSFAPIVGTNNITFGDYFPTMTGNSYLWSYGCGGGNYTQANGVGTTFNFASSNLEGIFTMMMGSYFGDWDNTNNFLRAPLCSGKMLANVWSGRPHWQFHHMALGENIGYSALMTHNNYGLYFGNYGEYFVHLGLMGDPTLRSDIIAPPIGVIATKNGANCNIAWASSPEQVLGYNIYVKSDSLPNYVKLNQTPIQGNTFTDNCLLYPGVYSYMVRAIDLEVTPSGSYYNMSQGIVDTVLNSNYFTLNLTTSFTINNNIVSFNCPTPNVTNYNWNFDDGSNSNIQNPTHSFTDGNYYVKLKASNTCASDSIEIPISIGLNNPPLKPSAISTSQTTICEGSNNIAFSIINVPSVTYTWAYSGTGATIVGTGNTVSISFASNATSGNLSVTPSNSNGSGVSSILAITIKSVPTISITGNSQICSGENSILSASGAISYVWSNASTANSITVSPLTNTNYSVVGTSSNGCTSIASNTISVSTPPIINLTSSIPSNTFCFGTAVSFTATQGFNNYVFKKNNVVIQNSSSNIYTTNSLTNNNVITVSVTNQDGCSATSNSITNAVSSASTAPTISIINGGVNPFCFGSSITLRSSATIGNVWSTGETTQDIVVDTTKAISLYYSLGTCQSAIANYNAIEKPALVAQINGVLNTCGSSTILNANTILNYPVGITYKWTFPNNSIQFGLTKTVTLPGDYILQLVTSDNCPSTTDTVSVNLGTNLTPVITASGPTTFCAGNAITLTSNIATGNYWSNGSTSQSIIVNQTGSYSVTVSNLGCSLTSQNVNVNVIPLPVQSIISATGPTTICQNNSITLTGNNGGIWNSTGSYSASEIIYNSGNYFVTTSNACGTVQSNTISVSVLQEPVAPVISALGSTKFCQGGSVTLNGNIGGVWNTTATTNSILVTTSGSYFVTVTNSCGSSFSNSIPVTVSPNSQPIATIIGNQNLCNNSGSVTISGNQNGIWNTGSNAFSITVTEPGNYFYTINSLCGGTLNSNIIIVSSDVNPTPSILTLQGSSLICEGDSSLITGNIGGLWNFNGNNSASVYIKQQGNYYVTNSNSCGSVISNIIGINTNYVPANPQVTMNQFICKGNVFSNNQGFEIESDSNVYELTKNIPFQIITPIVNEGTDYPGEIISSINIPTNLDIPINANIIKIELFIDGIELPYGGNSHEMQLVFTNSINNNNSNPSIQDLTSSKFNYSFEIPINDINTTGGTSEIFYYEINDDNKLASDCNFPDEGYLRITYTVYPEITWYTSNSYVNNIGVGSPFDPLQGNPAVATTTYYVANVLDGCASPLVPITLVVDTFPTAPIISTLGSTNFCMGDSVELFGNNNGYWNLNFSNSNNIEVFNTGEYFVSTNNSCGSDTSNKIIVNVDSLVNPEINIAIANGSETICTGTTVVFNANTLYGGNSPNFQWYKNGNLLNTNVVSLIDSTINDFDKIYCRLTSNAACLLTNVSTSDTIQMVVRDNGYWVGTNSNWNNSNNWCGGIPSATTNVVIPFGTLISPELNSESFCNSIGIANGTSISLNNQKLNVFGSVIGNGSFIGSSDSELSISGSGNAGNINMSRFTATSNLLKNLTINKSANGSVILTDTLKIFGNLNMNNGSLITNDRLRLISTSSQTGRIAPVSPTANIVGKVIAERFVPGGLTGWGTIGNSIKNDSISSWMDDFATSGFPGATGNVGSFVSVYNYDETTSGTSEFGYLPATNSSNIIENGKGYFVYLGTSSNNTSDINYEVMGAPAIGNVNLPVSYTPSIPNELVESDGWNLVANPYCSTIDWDNTSWVKTNIGSAIYTYNADLQQYATYVAGMSGIGINGGSNTIAASQGFWVKANAMNPTLIAKENIKIASNTNFLRVANSTNLPAGMLKIKLTSNYGADESLIVLNPNATSNFDIEYDAQKLYSTNPSVPNLATKLNSQTLAINTFDTLLQSEIKLETKITHLGIITLNFEGVNAFIPNMKLKDNLNQITTPFSHDTTFTFFISDTSNISNRYSLVFNQNIITENSSKSKDFEFYIFPNPGKDLLNLNFNKVNNNESIEIISSIGTIVFTQKIIGNKLIVNTKDFSNGIYFIKISNSNGEKFIQKWIKQ